MSVAATTTKTKSLLLMRHAKSSWKHPDLYDHERPLNKRGTRDAPRMGSFLLDRGLVPDAMLTSTAVRAKTTAQAVATASGFTGKIRSLEKLYGGTVEDYLHILSMAPAEADRILLIGHNPACEEVLQQLTKHIDNMPTSAIAEITLPVEEWSELSLSTRGDLGNLWRPKELL